MYVTIASPPFAESDQAAKRQFLIFTVSKVSKKCQIRQNRPFGAAVRHKWYNASVAAPKLATGRGV